MSRPSEKELWAKITRFREKIGAGDWLLVDPLKVVPQFQALNLWTEQERAVALESAANEIRPEHYKGGRPPVRAYERVCADADLFAFSWESAYFKRQMYRSSASSRRLFSWFRFIATSRKRFGKVAHELH